MQGVLVAGTVTACVSAVVFAMVGWVFLRRPVSPDLRMPRNAFAAWWFGLAGSTAGGAAQSVLFLAGRRDLQLFLTITIATLFLLCVALWGLLSYLAFLFLNTRRWAWVFAAGYAGFFFWLLYLTLSGNPLSVDQKGWSVQVTLEHDLTGTPTAVVAVLLLLLPQILGALGYLALYFRVQEAVQRRRILLVSLSILVWFGQGFLGFIPGLADSNAWQLTTRLLGIAAAGTILYAYTGLNGPGAGKPRSTPDPGSPPTSNPLGRKGQVAHAG